MSNWIGYAISVNCGEPLGCYQGTILEADGNTITLTKAFRNGFPYPKAQVTLNAADIKDLKIIESRAQPSEQTHSTVAVTKNGKKAQRATVCENLQANPTSSGNQAGSSSTSQGGGGGAGPPCAGWAGLTARAAVLGGLPAALAPSLGAQYLADVCVPAAMFAELEVEYRPPFGASAVLALHLATDAD
ncbi:enhancer of mRNA-decapping protein 3 [Spodoptera litura]|uniref:Enhancer of mRNA-decapping protein 3 n=1 Tax=Spodoptera litura TaxID=69820 RepID=A0A9J7DPZ0_SPOLT|nr:enhancer of mRNA-decapping protein 3 [Spodoptera litura]